MYLEERRKGGLVLAATTAYAFETALRNTLKAVNFGMIFSRRFGFF